MLRVVAPGCCHVFSSLFLLDHMWSREISGFAGTELDMCCDYWSRPRSKIKSIRCLISYLCAGFLANQESFKTCKVMCVPCLKWSAIKSLVFFGEFFFLLHSSQNPLAFKKGSSHESQKCLSLWKWRQRSIAGCLTVRKQKNQGSK